MTERKPPGLGWESWIDRQIRQATERGEFDDLPGAGKPISDLNETHDENWWVKRKLRSEGLSYLPPSLALRKQAAEARVAALNAATEADARRIVEDVNELIREANRTGIRGPSIMLVPYPVERLLEEWRRQHSSD
jgi:hypothetical protein